MATHSSMLAWRIPWTDSPWSRKELDTTERLSQTHTCNMKYHSKKEFGEGKQSSGGEQEREIVMHLKEVLFPYFIC